MTTELVLASASAARATVLRNAGVAVIQDPASIDEATMRDVVRSQDSTVNQAALRLAEAEALAVAMLSPGLPGHRRRPDPRSRWRLVRETGNPGCRGGREHRLISAVVLVQDERIIWRHVGIARLSMRAFDDRYLESYLDGAGANALGSVGAYRIEDVGIRLFEKIDGDHFTILGLPLLLLLSALRTHGGIDT